MKIRIAITGAFLAFVWLGILYFDYIKFKRSCAQTSFVTTFAASNWRSGNFSGCISPRWTTFGPLEAIPAGQHSLGGLPLYLNGRIVSLPAPFTGKRTIITPNYHGLRFIDMDTGQILLEAPWKLPSPPNWASGATPVLDPSTLTVYGLIVTGEKSHTNWLYRFSLTENQFDWLQLPLAKLFGSSKESQAELHAALHCKTALGLREFRGKKTVFGGCSLDRVRQRNYFSKTPGVRGGFFFLDLLAGGHLPSEKSVHVFAPVAKGPGNETGRDGTLWNSGAGVAWIPDMFLLATGNGLLNPAQRNYGCSIVALNADGKMFSPNSYLSFVPKQNRPNINCETWDLDLSSSAVASLTHAGKIYAAITGKDGVLKVFDPTAFSSNDRPTKSETELTANWIFGQPLMQIGKNGPEAFVFYNYEENWRAARFAINTDFSVKKIWEKSFVGQLPNSNPAITQEILITTALDENIRAESKNASSKLFILAAEDGSKLAEFSYPGSAHFSMPLPIEEYIFFNTRERDLFRLRAKSSFWAGLLKIFGFH